MEPIEKSLQNNLTSLSSEIRGVMSRMRQMLVQIKGEQTHIEKLEIAARRRKEDLEDLKKKYGYLDRRRKHLEDDITKVKNQLKKFNRRVIPDEVQS